MSMLETLFGFWMTCVVLVAVINLVPGATLAIRRGENEIMATARAQSVLEELRAGPFAELKSGPATTTYAPDGTALTPVVEVSDVAGSSPERLKRVRVTVPFRHSQVTQELLICNIVER